MPQPVLTPWWVPLWWVAYGSLMTLVLDRTLGRPWDTLAFTACMGGVVWFSWYWRRQRYSPREGTTGAPGIRRITFDD